MAGTISTERVSGVPGGHPSEPDPASKRRFVVAGVQARLGARRKSLKTRREKLSSAAQSRVGAKVKHLIESGEFPNTPAGRKKALGMAYGMARAGRLGPRGGYKRKGS